MKKGTAATEERLDGLYREHPGGFVAGRDRLAKDLREAGDRDDAERVRQLRRPTVAAWLVNRAALSARAELQELAEAGGELEAAQGRALDGEEGGAAEWRAAAARERDAIRRLVEAAERLARDAGHRASAPALQQAEETLRAASGDPELRERVLRGRVERERSAATLGTPSGPPPPRRGARAANRDLARARRELERLREELAGATEREQRLRARVEQAAEALRDEKAKLAEGRRETAALKRRVKTAERRAQR